MSAALLLQVHKDVSACYLLMSAAQLAVSRKAAAQQLASQRGGAATPFDAAAVRKGRYLGQVELKQPEGAPPGHRSAVEGCTSGALRALQPLV